MSDTFWAIKRREAAKGAVVIEKVKPVKKAKKAKKTKAVEVVKEIIEEPAEEPESNDADVTVEPA
jgi:hypothetical protein